MHQAGNAPKPHLTRAKARPGAPVKEWDRRIYRKVFILRKSLFANYVNNIEPDYNIVT